MPENEKVDTSLIRNMFIGRIRYQEWKDNGAIELPNVFDWILNGETWVLIREELNMYLWHQKDDLDMTDHGWLRTSMYTMLQQLVRQDIASYLLTVALRPDHATDLLAFPCFMRAASKDNSESIRRVDLNLKDLMSGRGENRIQGTAVFADESVGNGDEFILGLHLRMEKWWKVVTKRNLATDGYTQYVVPEMFNTEDSRRSSLKWVGQACTAGSARFYMPHLPHGKRGKSGERRISVPTYHTAVSRNGVNMEIAECGTRDEIAAALRD